MYKSCWTLIVGRMEKTNTSNDCPCNSNTPNDNQPGLPWFHRNLTATTDYIELRDCASYTASNENVFISLYEIYIK